MSFFKEMINVRRYITIKQPLKATRTLFNLLIYQVKRFFKKTNYPDYILVSYPKSGRTWLRLMLNHFGISLNASHDRLSDKRKSYGDISFNPQWTNKKVIFLIRDPRDVVVSNYFQATKRGQYYNGTLADFIRDEKVGIKKILRYYEIWYNNQNRLRDFLLVRYEELHDRPYAVLKGVLRFLNEHPEEARIHEAVRKCSFENMKRLEREGALAKEWGPNLMPPNPSDEESYKVRKGRIGGYKEYMSQDDIRYCNSCMKESSCPWYKAETV